jgi:hypothetical protein
MWSSENLPYNQKKKVFGMSSFPFIFSVISFAAVKEFPVPEK